MYPNQNNQNGQQPSMPNQQPTTLPQQHANGQYEVVPTLPPGTGQHTGHNPYEFIVNPNSTKRKSTLFGGDAFLKRIAVIVGGAIALIVIATIAITALAPSQSSTTALTSIAQRQQEIIRLSGLASSQSTDQGTQNFATTVNLTITSNQNAVTTYLAAHHVVLKSKILGLDHNTKTDSLLSAATASSTFNSVVTQQLTDQLKTYETQLTAAYKGTSNKTVKALLQASYNSAAQLAKNAATSGQN